MRVKVGFLAVAVVNFFFFSLAGCATSSGVWNGLQTGAKEDIATLERNLRKMMNGETFPSSANAHNRVPWQKVSVKERSIVLQAMLTCESSYVPPASLYEFDSMERETRRYEYESCLQKEYEGSINQDVRYVKLLKSACSGLKGASLTNCRESIRVSAYCQKARDTLQERDAEWKKYRTAARGFFR